MRACNTCGGALTAGHDNGEGSHKVCPPKGDGYEAHRERLAKKMPGLTALHDHLREHGEATASTFEELHKRFPTRED